MPLLDIALTEHDPHALTPLQFPVSGRAATADARYAGMLERAGLGEVLHRRLGSIG